MMATVTCMLCPILQSDSKLGVSYYDTFALVQARDSHENHTSAAEKHCIEEKNGENQLP